MSRPGTAQVAAADYSRRDLLGHKQTVSAIAWAGNGKRLASVSEDGMIKLWNVEHGGTVSIRSITSSHAPVMVHMPF